MSFFSTVNLKGNQRKYPLKLTKLLSLKYQRKGLMKNIDEKLTSKPHINYISLQARKSFFYLAAFPLLTPATLVTIYKSLIRSHIEYCCSTWSHQLYSNNNLKTRVYSKSGLVS